MIPTARGVASQSGLGVRDVSRRDLQDFERV
ncbi:MAG: hypothetical protein JWO31_4208, partial [Phycisphaerales bacterium]|nr:hypothetical protein [Phycisphaerales bacterium]